MAGVGGEINKSDASAFFRFRKPHNLRGDFDALTGVGQRKTYAWEVFTHYREVSHSNGHSRLTYIQDKAAIGIAELDIRERSGSGARLKAAITRRSQGREVRLQV